MRLLVVGLTIILAASLVISCGRGDRAHEVYLYNASDSPVVIFYEFNSNPIREGRVAPRETKKVAWAYLDMDRVVKAYDEQEVLVFCQRYSESKLKTIDWKVEITRGQLDCD